MKIFVTVGSQKFPFDRLLKEIDRLVEHGFIKDDIIAQTGYCNYVPRSFPNRRFYDREEFDKCIDCADIVITHGGTGVIINALKKRKKVIAVPRLKKYGEHVNDHQLQLIKEFRQSNLVYECRDCSRLDLAIEEVKKRKFSTYISNPKEILKSIDDFIMSIP